MRSNRVLNLVVVPVVEAQTQGGIHCVDHMNIDHPKLSLCSPELLLFAVRYPSASEEGGYPIAGDHEWLGMLP